MYTTSRDYRSLEKKVKILELRDLVLIVDVSPSMGKSYQDLRPSKLHSVKEALAYFIPQGLKAGNIRMGIVVFYRIAFPVLHPTEDGKKALRTISLLDIGGPGSAPGNGLIEAVKILRNSVRKKKALLLTDGGFNEGIRLDYAAVYASNSKVRVDIVVIGEPERSDREVIMTTTELTKGKAYEIKEKKELFSILNMILQD